MSTKISDAEGTRHYTVEADNALLPGSVFFWGDNGVAIEFRVEDVIAVCKREFGLLEPLDIGLAAFLEREAA